MRASKREVVFLNLLFFSTAFCAFYSGIAMFISEGHVNGDIIKLLSIALVLNLPVYFLIISLQSYFKYGSDN
jgi:hypothetical protein